MMARTVRQPDRRPASPPSIMRPMSSPTMHAWRVHAYGSYRDQLRWEECPAPTAPETGVVVRVTAAALNFPDLLAVAGTYQVKAPLPFTPGIEACGVVESAGARSIFRPGQRVIA